MAFAVPNGVGKQRQSFFSLSFYPLRKALLKWIEADDIKSRVAGERIIRVGNPKLRS